MNPTDHPRRGRALRSIALASLLALSAGCIWNLPKDLVVFTGLDTCPELDLDQLPERARAFDHATEDFELACALEALRSAALPSDAHWTATPARICYLLADRARDQDETDRLAAEGVRWAEIALERGGPEPGQTHYYLAINLGLAMRAHTVLAMKNLGRLEKALKEAVRLAPGEEQGGPLRLLGVLYMLAPPWPDGIGDGDKALDFTRRAVKEYPEHPLNLMFLAQVLLEVEEEDGVTEARELLLRARKSLEEQPAWRGARARWTKELDRIARDAKLKL